MNAEEQTGKEKNADLMITIFPCIANLNFAFFTQGRTFFNLSFCIFTEIIICNVYAKQ